MKWYHLIVWGGLMMSSRNYSAIRLKIDELHLESGEYEVGTSFTMS
jgi:hypothetical protein